MTQMLHALVQLVFSLTMSETTVYFGSAALLQTAMRANIEVYSVSMGFCWYMVDGFRIFWNFVLCIYSH